jgi:nucleolar protein 12
LAAVLESRDSRECASHPRSENEGRQGIRLCPVQGLCHPSSIFSGKSLIAAQDENAVEAALLMNDKKYPPLLPRKLRVMRAKSGKYNPANIANSSKREDNRRTIPGRTGKLLGKAAAAKLRRDDNSVQKRQKVDQVTQPTSEPLVFEGTRAKSKDGKLGLKFGSKKKGKKAPRRTQRSKSWRASK